MSTRFTQEKNPGVSIEGSTMNDTYPLLLKTLLDRGPKLQPDNLIITRTPTGYHHITYAEHMTRAYKLASALTKRGVLIGDRVATFMWNNARHLQCYHAVPCMGAVLHTLNIRLGPKELGFIMDHADDKVVFIDADLLKDFERVWENEETRAQISNVELFVICGLDETPGGWKSILPAHMTVDFDDFIADEPSYYEWPDLDENHPMGLCYTSGTTGNPKGVAYSHRSTYLHTVTVAMPDALCLSGLDVMAPVVPMFHAMCWGVPFVALMLGSRFCNNGRCMSPADTLSICCDWGVTFSAAVPTVWQTARQMMEANPSEFAGKWKVQRIICGGSAPPSEMMNWYWEQHGTEFMQGWGMTETNPSGSIARQRYKFSHSAMTDSEAFDNVTNCGVTYPGLEWKIVDTEDFDKELPQDGEAQGELLIRGPWVTSAYYKNPQPTKFHKGWLSTGDIASITAGGQMIIRDRSKDVIKSGGEWISSVDVENHIVGLPEVTMCAVVAQPHPKWDERPVAVVTVTGGASGFSDQGIKEKALAHCAAVFAKYEIPDDILVWEELPVTATGKLDKKNIRAKLEEENYVLPSLRDGPKSRL